MKSSIPIRFMHRLHGTFLRRNAITFLAAVLICGLSPMAHAADGDGRPEPIRQLASRGFSVEKRFAAEAGLMGWVIRRDGKSAVVYTTPDNAHLVVGSLIDVRGQDLTAGYSELYGDRRDLQALYSKLDGAKYIAEGPSQSKVVIHVFFDPNCTFCHGAWNALKPYERSGLQVRWIPVAFLKPSSEGRAAAIMEAKRPAEALVRNETDFNETTEDGGIKPIGKAKPDTVRALAANRHLMSAFDGTGTPLFVWKDIEGKVRLASGLPPISEIADMIWSAPRPVPGSK